jgi:hypothetical protein
MWMRMGMLALLAFLVLRETTRVHLMFLKSGKGLTYEEKEDLNRLLEMLVLISIGTPRRHRIWAKERKKKKRCIRHPTRVRSSHLLVVQETNHPSITDIIHNSTLTHRENLLTPIWLLWPLSQKRGHLLDCSNPLKISMPGHLGQRLHMSKNLRHQIGMPIVQRATSLRLMQDILRDSIHPTSQQPMTQMCYEKNMDTIVSIWMDGTDVVWASVEDARYVVHTCEHGQ